MATKDLLIRDSRYDNGSIPSGTSYCSSPDLIIHEQVADPQTFFKNNYNDDVNQSINKGAAHNFIYTRCKNLSDKNVKACIRMYASTSSLFMQPSLWRQNILKDMNEVPYVETNIIGKNDIGVGLKPFIFDAKGKNTFCHVGYVTESREIQPDFPASDFRTYSEFTSWITNNPHICLRNFSVITGKPSYSEYPCFMSNPNDYACPYSLQVTLRHGYPKGTVIEFKNTPAHMDVSYTVQEVKDKIVFQIAGTELLEPHFEGYLIASVFLPSGTTFKGGDVNIEFFPGERFTQKFLAATVRHLDLGQPINRSARLEEGTRLIKAGECSVRFT